MEIRQLKEFSEISGVRRSPTTTEHNKFPKWNNNTKKFDYSCISTSDIIDLPDYVEKSAYVDDYLTTVAQTQTGSANSNYWASFTMNNPSNPTKYLKLGRLAWLDSFELPTLPGDMKVLFDQSNSIGGNAAFKYNYTTNKLLFQGTPLLFDTSTPTGTYKEGLKFLGNYSWAIGGGIETSASGSYNIQSGYKAGFNLGASSARNSIYGPYAGEFADPLITDSIFIGAYSGRRETSSGAFFLDIVNYDNTVNARLGSFMYADLLTERRLYIRDRLSVSKEGMFGDSGLLDAAGEGGMFQMIDGGGGIIKPQYHNGRIWCDFAVGNNYYLQEISEDGTTDGLYHFLIKDSTGITTIHDLTLQLPLLDDIDVPVAYTPSYPNITASDYGYIQISNTSTSTNNGFYYKTGFKWDNANSELDVPGALKLSTKSSYTALNGVIRWDDTLDHYYGMINGTWVQLDNDVVESDRNGAINMGDGEVEWYYMKDADNNLLLRTFDVIPLGNTYNPYGRLHLTYTDDGYTAMIGTTAERNYCHTVINDILTEKDIFRGKNGEVLELRALKQGSNIILTETDEYIRIDAIAGVGGGEANSCSNIGDVDLFYRKNGIDFEFFGLQTTDSRLTIGQATGPASPNNTFALDLELFGNSIPITTVATYGEEIYHSTANGNGTTPTIYIKPIISDDIIITTTANDEILLSLPSSPTVVSLANEGNGVEVYDDDNSVAPNHLFRTLSSSNSNLTITQDTLTILFDAEDVVATAKAGATGNTTYVATNAALWGVDVKGLVEGNNVTITDDGNDLTFDIPDIQKFEIVSSDFVKTTEYAGSVDSYGSQDSNLSFKLSHSDNGVTYIDREILNIGIGGALKYDEVNNVLFVNMPALEGVALFDYHLTSITDNSTIDNYIFAFNVDDGNGNPPSGFVTPTLTIPKSSVPTATYTDYTGSTGNKGVIKIEDFVAAWPLGNTTPLTLDEATGKLSGNKLLVTYESQNNLHDEDNVDLTLPIPPGVTLDVNTLRRTARANIGSAYVNGSLTEHFNSLDLTAARTFSAANVGVTHTIGNIKVLADRVYSDGAELTIARSDSDTLPRMVLSSTETKIYLPRTQGASLVIYDVNGGVSTPMFRFNSSTGDLYVKGSIHTGGTIEAFDSSIDSELGS